MEILAEGTYKGHRYTILNLGTHPTAYVEEKLGVESYEDEILDRVDVHGGFTYFDFPHWKEGDRKYLGWDYAHSWDYSGSDEF